MPRVARITPVAHAFALVGAVAAAMTGCNFKVPSSSYLSETKLITVVVEVDLVGPEALNPGRVQTPSDATIAEAMPHDRLRFAAFVADRDGARVPDDELDSLWFQCGAYDCGDVQNLGSEDLFATDCEDLEGEGPGWTMDAVCRIGHGSGRFEFLVPELDQILAEQRVAQYYGVIAWAGRTAESCWSVRQSSDGSLDHCGFIQRSVKIGPSWWMLAYAEQIGLTSPIPLPLIPVGVLIQQANRVPVASFAVSVDGELRGTWPEQTTFSVKPGADIEVDASYDVIEQLSQSYFIASPIGPPEAYVFKASVEQVHERPFTSNAIVAIEFDPVAAGSPIPLAWDFAVDEYAEPGTSRILMYYFDDRYGEDVATLEFEVEG